jgi:hypothetical protein
MNIVSVISPKYSKSDNSSIDAMVTFDNGQTYPYTSTATDSAPYGAALWAALNAGTYGAILPYSS